MQNEKRAEDNRQKKNYKRYSSRIEIFKKYASSRMRPTVTSLSCSEPAWRHSFDDVWSTAVNAPSRRFLQGTIMLGSLASTSCAFVHVHGGRAPRRGHVRALHRKIPGVRKVRFLHAMRKFATWRFCAIVLSSNRYRYIKGYFDSVIKKIS